LVDPQDAGVDEAQRVLEAALPQLSEAAGRHRQRRRRRAADGHPGRAGLGLPVTHVAATSKMTVTAGV
jgi:hypothetical protein